MKPIPQSEVETKTCRFCGHFYISPCDVPERAKLCGNVKKPDPEAMKKLPKGRAKAKKK
jgi:hypothetical protein